MHEKFLMIIEKKIACEQAPKWGKEKSASRASRARYGELDFCLCAIPRLGACSQAKKKKKCLFVKLSRYYCKEH